MSLKAGLMEVKRRRFKAELMERNKMETAKRRRTAGIDIIVDSVYGKEREKRGRGGESF